MRLAILNQPFQFNVLCAMEHWESNQTLFAVHIPTLLSHKTDLEGRHEELEHEQGRVTEDPSEVLPAEGQQVQRSREAAGWTAGEEL